MPAKKIAIVETVESPYALIMQSAYDVLLDYSSFSPVKGKNLVNWKDGMIGNSSVGFEVFVTCINLKAKKRASVTLPIGFSPASKKSNDVYYSEIVNGKLDSLGDALSLFGYLLSQIMEGKHFSLVSLGRAKMLQSMLDGFDGLISDLTIVIRGCHTGGNSSPRDMTLDLVDIHTLVKFYTLQGKKTIENLPKIERVRDTTSSRVERVIVTESEI